MTGSDGDTPKPADGETPKPATRNWKKYQKVAAALGMMATGLGLIFSGMAAGEDEKKKQQSSPAPKP